MDTFELIIIAFVLVAMALLATLSGVIRQCLVFMVTVLPILLIVLVYLGTDELAHVSDFGALTQADIKRVRSIFDQQLNNPKHIARALTLSEKDLNIVSNQLANRAIKSASQIDLRDKAMIVNISITLPDNPVNPFLNIHFQLLQQDKQLVITQLKVGAINIADELASWLVKQLIEYSQFNQYYWLVNRNVEGFTISSQALVLNYFWDQAKVKQSQHQLAPVPNQDVATFYRQQLQGIVKNHNRKWLLSLADLLQPMFKEAYRHSQHVNPIDENRAIIYVVNNYVNQRKIQALFPDLILLPSIEYLPVFIYKRIDLAQHFMASAALTVFGNAQFTHLLGLEKEMRDADKGSGFSFIDLAADRAGVRFAETATESGQSARQLQKNMAKITSYQAFMPVIEQLPRNMSRLQFTERFISVNSKAYHEQLMAIDSSIASCAIYLP